MSLEDEGIDESSKTNGLKQEEMLVLILRRERLEEQFNGTD